MIDAKSKMKILIIVSVFTLLSLIVMVISHVFLKSIYIDPDWTQKKQINDITERVGMHV